jgi:hypothetical protein
MTHPKRSKLQDMLFFGIIALIISFAVLVVFFTLLANDIWTIPYLTPLAHFFRAVVRPLIPLVVPSKIPFLSPH